MVEIIVTTLGTLLVYLQSERIHRNEMLDEGIQSVIEALDKTEEYVQVKNAQPNRTTELHLSTLWDIAGNKMQRVDPTLAEIFSQKSSYWKAIKKLSRKDILENKMALWQVRESLAKAISKK